MFTSSRFGLPPKGDPFPFTPMASLGHPWTEYVVGKRRMIECVQFAAIFHTRIPQRTVEHGERIADSSTEHIQKAGDTATAIRPQARSRVRNRSNTLRATVWHSLTRSHRLLIIVSLDNKCRGAHAATMHPFDVLRDLQNDTHIAVHGRTEAVYRETDCSQVIRLQ